MNFSHCNLCIQSNDLHHPYRHLLVQATTVSCLDNYNNLLTGLPTFNLVLLSSTIHREGRIIFLKINQIMSLPCLRFFTDFPHHQENPNTLLWHLIMAQNDPTLVYISQLISCYFSPSHDAPGAETFFQFNKYVQLFTASGSLNLPSTVWNVLPTAPQMADFFSSIRSQMKCHLLREDYSVHLTKAPVTSLSWHIISFIAHITTCDYVIYLSVDCLPSKPSPTRLWDPWKQSLSCSPLYSQCCVWYCSTVSDTKQVFEKYLLNEYQWRDWLLESVD